VLNITSKILIEQTATLCTSSVYCGCLIRYSMVLLRYLGASWI